MPWTTLIFFSLTLIFWRFTQLSGDEVLGFLGNLATATCLILGLATAPIFIKSIILVLLLLTPSLVFQKHNFSNPTD
ncbi:MAG: hypothetical protein AAF821_21280 [Cyanobacteria bacterium P01_D01_bin.156]